MKFFVLLVLASFILGSLGNNGAPYPCTAQWQCEAVSNDYNYVTCGSNGFCQCLSANAFDGNATIASPCTCDAPKTVYWNGPPYCINYIQSAALTVKSEREQMFLEIVMNIYEDLVGITPILIATTALSVNNLFNPNAVGRVTPVGHFNGIILQQYFFALAAAGNVSNVYFINLEADENVVTVRVDIEFTPATGWPAPAYNLTQTGFFYFDNTNRVGAVDLAILNLGDILDTTNTAIQQGQIEQICATINGNPALGQTQGTCNGANQQYASFSACVAYLNTIPFGSYNRANSNSVVCRSIHQIMTVLPPVSIGANVHCPHVGPTGGGMCIDFPYTSFYTNDVLNQWS